MSRFKSSHQSRWLNMAESELGVLSSQCLDRGIGDNKRSSMKSAPGKQNGIAITPRPIGGSQPKPRG